MSVDTRKAARETLIERVHVELQRSLPTAIDAFAAHLVAGKSAACAVLFYGSTLRTGDLESLLDYYVIVDDLTAWHGQRIAAIANGWLPPNVSFETFDHEGRTLRAKVAVLSRDQFERGMQTASIDTTLWARFAQPIGLPWTRDEASKRRIESIIADAIGTAAHWAALLGPEQAEPAAFWSALFRHTYSAELRVEGAAGRSKSIIEHERARYEALLPLAWRSVGIDYTVRVGVRAGVRAGVHSDELSPRLSTQQREQGQRAWNLRKRLGKPLNMARILKASFTFHNGADYIAWKVERHSGYKLELSDWQRRHPLLAAPLVLVKLKRAKVL
ncbi:MULTISPECIES: hypothetical protein [Hydrocarboniphaga]|uniref:Uncharacterized protein n=1 Tax=Hydrocarboniphaga effusa AP103 TaxID=1172194 RepID=I8I0A3_9GAMM|nr:MULTISPECIES: hypothetical protein [Hydrocarboniphaga]EIT69401.1 hypothetical protein WQQ_29830 [Hydrocarboniphaga effusa AP103]MDZ4079194.1 hypothetical protein [Hydrocarboniphaga sp.]